MEVEVDCGAGTISCGTSALARSPSSSTIDGRAAASPSFSILPRRIVEEDGRGGLEDAGKLPYFILVILLIHIRASMRPAEVQTFLYGSHSLYRRQLRDLGLSLHSLLDFLYT